MFVFLSFSFALFGLFWCGPLLFEGLGTSKLVHPIWHCNPTVQLRDPQAKQFGSNQSFQAETEHPILRIRHVQRLNRWLLWLRACRAITSLCGRRPWDSRPMAIGAHDSAWLSWPLLRTSCEKCRWWVAIHNLKGNSKDYIAMRVIPFPLGSGEVTTRRKPWFLS